MVRPGEKARLLGGLGWKATTPLSSIRAINWASRSVIVSDDDVDVELAPCHCMLRWTSTCFHCWVDLHAYHDVVNT
jgi:hypothetical protein